MKNKLFFCFLVFLIHGCDMSGVNSDGISKVFLDSEKGEIVPLGKYVDRKNVDACVLVPYQDSLRDDGSEKIKQINLAIKKSDLSVSEGVWNFIIWDKNSLESIPIRTNSAYTIKQGGFSQDFLDMFSSVGFLNASCAEIEKIAFLKYEIRNRTFLTFGVNKV